MSNSDRAGRLAAIQGRFLARLQGDLEQCRAWAQGERSEAQQARLLALLHALKGAAGSVGFQAVGERAATLEGCVRESLGEERALEELERAANEALEAAAQGGTAWTAHEPHASPAELSAGRARLVCFEDDPDIAAVVRIALAGSGLTIEVHADGAEGWRQLESAAPPELILLDLMLPGLTGLELLDRIHANEDLSPVPVLVLSARTLGDEVREAMDRGANAFLPKPFEISELERLVGSLRNS